MTDRDEQLDRLIIENIDDERVAITDLRSLRKDIRAYAQSKADEARISELLLIMPPEQYRYYAMMAGQSHCVVCGFDSEKFRQHIEERIATLKKGSKG